MHWLPDDDCYIGYSLKKLGKKPEVLKDELIGLFVDNGYSKSDITEDLLQESINVMNLMIEYVRSNHYKKIDQLKDYYHEIGLIRGVIPVEIDLAQELLSYLIQKAFDIGFVLGGVKAYQYLAKLRKEKNDNKEKIIKPIVIEILVSEDKEAKLLQKTIQKMLEDKKEKK